MWFAVSIRCKWNFLENDFQTKKNWKTKTFVKLNSTFVWYFHNFRDEKSFFSRLYRANMQTATNVMRWWKEMFYTEKNQRLCELFGKKKQKNSLLSYVVLRVSLAVECAMAPTEFPYVENFLKHRRHCRVKLLTTRKYFNSRKLNE